MTATTAHVLHDTYPITLPIDGREIQCQIKRFDLGEYTAFMRDFARVGRMAKRDEMRMERTRSPARDPATGQPKQRPVIAADGQPTDALEIVLETDEEVLARLDLDETDAQRATRERRDEEETAFAVTFLCHAITSYVTCEPGQLMSTTAPITSGGEILRYYGARQDVLQGLLHAIYVQNIFDDDTKKKLASPPALPSGSTASTPIVPGDAPAPTAAPVSAQDSASPAIVMG